MKVSSVCEVTQAIASMISDLKEAADVEREGESAINCASNDNQIYYALKCNVEARKVLLDTLKALNNIETDFAFHKEMMEY